MEEMSKHMSMSTERGTMNSTRTIKAGRLASLAALGALMVGMFPAASAGAAPAQQSGCQTFPETGKTVCEPFLSYWNSHGGLAQQGYPISAQMDEKSPTNG